MSQHQQLKPRAWTKKRGKDLLVDLFFYGLLLAISMTCLLPFVHIFAKSISQEAYVIANKIFLIPKGRRNKRRNERKNKKNESSKEIKGKKEERNKVSERRK